MATDVDKMLSSQYVFEEVDIDLLSEEDRRVEMKIKQSYLQEEGIESYQCEEKCNKTENTILPISRSTITKENATSNQSFLNNKENSTKRSSADLDEIKVECSTCER